VRDDVGVSERGEGDTATPNGNGSGEVLANLPRTRPQRPSARRQAMRQTSPGPAETSGATPSKRAAAKRPAAKQAGANAAPAKGPTAKGPATKGSAKGAGRRTAAPTGRARGTGTARGRASAPKSAPEARAPAQGFESATGSVRPPTGAEVLGTAVEAAGELAQAGVRAGGRLVRGALSLLPRP
jgi:DNA polymerase-3 subunit gamma/tau